MSARRYLLHAPGALVRTTPAAARRGAAALAESARAFDKHVNQHGAATGRRNPYPGERRGPLGADQKARLCILAREAFERLHGRGPVTAAELSAWRHEQQRQACGFDSLTHATQAHWPALEAHFLDLTGASGQAFQRLMQPEMGRQRQALAVLRTELEKKALPEAYAAAICRQQYKCTLAEASANQLWRLVFTVRNRKKS